MEQQRRTLQQDLDSLTDQIEALEQALEVKPNYGMGQGDPAVTQWELDLAILKQLKTKRENLQDALGRLATDAYGLCEHCGKRINPERLAVLPDATVCMECAQKGLKARQG